MEDLDGRERFQIEHKQDGVAPHKSEFSYGNSIIFVQIDTTFPGSDLHFGNHSRFTDTA